MVDMRASNAALYWILEARKIHPKVLDVVFNKADAERLATKIALNAKISKFHGGIYSFRGWGWNLKIHLPYLERDHGA